MALLRRILWLCLIVIVLSGCAGRKYNLADVSPDLQLTSSSARSIAIATLDQRKFVLSGESPPSYIGVQRGGFAIPHNINTESGLPFSNDLTNAVAASFTKKGFKVFPVYTKVADGAKRISELFAETKADRYLLFDVKKWESDTYINIGLDYEIELIIYAPGMSRLESVKVSEYKDIPRSGWETSPYIARREVPLAFKNVLEKLLNYPAILKSISEQKQGL